MPRNASRFVISDMLALVYVTMVIKKTIYIAIQSLYVIVFMAYVQHKRVRVMSFVNVQLKVSNNVRRLTVLTIGWLKKTFFQKS